MPKKFQKVDHDRKRVHLSGKSSLCILIPSFIVKKLKIELGEEIEYSVNNLDDTQEGLLYVKFFRKEEE